MKSLKDHIVENANTARGPRKKRRRDRDPAAETEPVSVIVENPKPARGPRKNARSDLDPADGIEPVRVILGLDAAAAVLLPAGIDLETRAERMNQFWRALVQFQYQDLIVVA